MTSMVVRTGAVLALVGAGVLVGYIAYFVLKAIFQAEDIPVAIKVALPIIIIGVVLLIGGVLWERLRSQKKERFGETRY